MKQSAGILLYKRQNDELYFFLVHPGGPFWKNKDEGAWSVPKGEFTGGENAFAAAIREFQEETGIVLKGEEQDYTALSPVRLKSGKRITAWALEQDVDVSEVVSNTFEMEWPPKSGKKITVPEIDKAEWFPLNIALEKINEAQRGFIFEMEELI